MIIKQERIHSIFDRDLYWVKIHFISDDQKEKSLVVAAAPDEYFLYNPIFKDKPREKQLNEWVTEVIEKYKNFGDDIFKKMVHYHISYYGSDRGKADTIDFLKKIVGSEQIEFVEFLPRTGTYSKALFKVGDQDVKIGITDTLLAIWNVQRDEVKLLLIQLAKLKIPVLVAAGKWGDYTFQTYDFQKSDGLIMPFEEAIESLQAKLFDVAE